LVEREQITQFFTVLKHPIRREILNILSQEEALSFSELMRSVNLKDTGTFGFHLNVLGPLLKQDTEGQYCLSDLGKTAHQLIISIEKTKEVTSMNKTEKKEIKPLLQISVEGTQEAEELTFGFWMNVKERKNGKKILDFVQEKLKEVESFKPKPICEIQVGLTQEGMTTVGQEWLTELNLAEKKRYFNLLIDKLKFMRDKELHD
jgi:DNA-binding transcriptional ArsR family regulator